MQPNTLLYETSRKGKSRDRRFNGAQDWVLELRMAITAEGDSICLFVGLFDKNVGRGDDFTILENTSKTEFYAFK